MLRPRSLRHRGDPIVVEWVKEEEWRGEDKEGRQGGNGQHQHQADLVPGHGTVKVNLQIENDSDNDKVKAEHRK